MTATDIVDDPDFVAFCRCWERDGRCPIGLADWLRERGLAGQGDAAQWAAEQPDREFAGESGGVRPFDGYPWCSTTEPHSRSTVPRDVEKSIREITDRDLKVLDSVYRSYRGGIALLLDGWAAARGPNRPEPASESCATCSGTGYVGDDDRVAYDEMIGRHPMVPPHKPCPDCKPCDQCGGIVR